MKEIIASRSLKRTQNHIAKASLRRQDLLDKQKLSLPSGDGVLSIIVSKSADQKATTIPEEQYKAFIEEAERLAHEREQSHQEVRIRPFAVPLDIKMELASPEVTDVIMIGHGSIGCLWTDGGGYLGWKEVAKATNYLKQGRIEQRMCGSFPLQYNIPLGTFAVTSLSNVWAAPNLVVPDVNPADELFRPIYNDSDGVRKQIEALNEAYGDVEPVEARVFRGGNPGQSSLY